jgi:hypothetical protein
MSPVGPTAIPPQWPQFPPATQAERAAAAPSPARPGFPPAGRYVLIGLAAVLMLLGLFALPWIKVSNGHGTTGQAYPKVASAITKYGGGDLNWWQHLYNEWFAVVLAVIMLIAVTATVAVVTRRPPPVPKWTWVPCLVSFALMFAHYQGLPDFPAFSGASTSVLGGGSVGLGYLLLALACPTPPTSKSAANRPARSA